MPAKEKRLKGNPVKKGVTRQDLGTNGLGDQSETGKRTYKEATLSDIVSFSQITLIGLVLFVIVLLVTALNFVKFEEGRSSLGLYGIAILVLLLGLVLDYLRWREFSEWGALGAIVTYLGLVMIFIPLILLPVAEVTKSITWIAEYTSWLADDTTVLIIILFGVIVTIIGFTTHRTEFDHKVEELAAKLWKAFREFDFRQLFNTFGQLAKEVVEGVFRTIGRGFKELRSRIKIFIILSYQIFEKTVNHFLKILTVSFPQALTRTAQTIWNNMHWVGLISVIIYLAMNAFPPEDFYLNTETFIIIGFFFSFGVIYPQRERLEQVVHRVQEYSWETMMTVNERIRNFGSNRRKMICRSCQEEIPLNTNACSSCETIVKKCNICRLPLKSGEEVTSCESCENPFHKNHWEQWIGMGRSCPICRIAATLS